MTKEISDGADPLKIVTMNVAGIRAAWKKGMLEYVETQKPDIICLQETKLCDTSKPPVTEYEIVGYAGYHYFCQSKKGYSGTAIYTKIKPISCFNGLDDDDEGRVLVAEFAKFYLVTVYVPNAGRKLERLDFKTTKWNQKLEAMYDELKKQKTVILCGDLNVAHENIDIYDPKGKDKTAGFTPSERQYFDGFIKRGNVDIFRRLHPDLQQFTFFSYMGNARARGSGWRLDYFVTPESQFSTGFVTDCVIEGTPYFSDHQPVMLLTNRDVLLAPGDEYVSAPSVELITAK